MCGICGMIGRSNKELLKEMCEVLAHRGPDDEGMYIDHNAAIGIRRLSIIDLETGHQPIHNEDESLWIVFNGEIYNYRDLRVELEKKGHHFYTKSDTEVIFHSYEEYGDKCVMHFNGMFAFAIWDSKKKELFMARDRVGIKPLFYWQNSHYLLFGSEIKAILQDRNFQREINFTALYNYLSRLFVPGNDTIFKGIKRLPPGYFLKYKDGQLKMERYWQIDFSRKIHLTEEEYCDQIYDLLKKSVKRRLVADVPIGVFLSGGVDSSGIVGLMSELCDKPVKTFSLGFIEADKTVFNELPYAKSVADHFGTEHYEFVARAGDLIEDLPQILWYFDEPFGGALPQYFLSNLARKHVKVALGGLGGDELFGSYGRSVRLSNILSPEATIYQKLPGLMRGIIEKSANISSHARNFLNRVRMGNIYANLYCPFTEEMKRVLCQKTVLDEVDEQDTLPFMLQSYFDEANSREFMDRMFYLDLKTQLVGEYLHYTDILSMAYSLEMRVPYLDHEFIEFVAKIPSQFRSKPENEKYLLKKTLSRILPEEIIHRKKGGFSFPYAAWLNKELKRVVDNCLSFEVVKKRGYFNPAFVRKIIDEFYLQGKDENTYRIWILLMFELWHQIYIDDHCYKKTDVKLLG